MRGKKSCMSGNQKLMEPAALQRRMNIQSSSAVYYFEVFSLLTLLYVVDSSKRMSWQSWRREGAFLESFLREENHLQVLLPKQRVAYKRRLQRRLQLFFKVSVAHYLGHEVEYFWRVFVQYFLQASKSEEEASRSRSFAATTWGRQQTLALRLVPDLICTFCDLIDWHRYECSFCLWLMK